MSKQLATWYGVGTSGKAPGTRGSLVAAVMILPTLIQPMGWAVVSIASILVFIIGCVAASRYSAQENTVPDASEIVIDEVAGQWFTYAVCYAWLAAMTPPDAVFALLAEISLSPFILIGGFVLFRVFDIVKPWPISLADRRMKGGFGVMLDDMLAGLAAGTFLFAAYVLWPLLRSDVVVAL